METSTVRKRVNEAIELARREAGERRTRADQAAREYAQLLKEVATPLFRQIVDSLKAGSFHFSVFTPSGAVRLASDRAPEDFIELTLDTTGERPVVMLHTSRARGRRIIENERAIAADSVAAITDAQLLDEVMKELRPFVEK
jgi:hypothetical protein